MATYRFDFDMPQERIPPHIEAGSVAAYLRNYLESNVIFTNVIPEMLAPRRCMRIDGFAIHISRFEVIWDVAAQCFAVSIQLTASRMTGLGPPSPPRGQEWLQASVRQTTAQEATQETPPEIPAVRRFKLPAKRSP